MKNCTVLIVGLIMSLQPFYAQQSVENEILPKYSGPSADIEIILSNITKFSAYYMAEDASSISKCYTIDGKIMPNGTKIIEGREAIEKRWTVSEGTDVISHKVIPEEIIIEGNTAYDYGYYNGSTKTNDDSIDHWQGKYVIVWKKIEGNWLIYLDIWNRVNN